MKSRLLEHKLNKVGLKAQTWVQHLPKRNIHGLKSLNPLMRRAVLPNMDVLVSNILQHTRRWHDRRRGIPAKLTPL